jgi:hypothetical protein
MLGLCNLLQSINLTSLHNVSASFVSFVIIAFSFFTFLKKQKKLFIFRD